MMVYTDVNGMVSLPQNGHLSGVVAQVSQQVMTSQAPGDRYTRGLSDRQTIDGRPRFARPICHVDTQAFDCSHRSGLW